MPIELPPPLPPADEKKKAATLRVATCSSSTTSYYLPLAGTSFVCCDVAGFSHLMTRFVRAPDSELLAAGIDFPQSKSPRWDSL